MAVIDKIYMTEKQGIQFLTWILDHNDECIELTGRSMVDNFYKSENGYITNYPEAIDWYLSENKFLAVVDFFLDTGFPVEFRDAPDFIRFVRDYADELKAAVWKRMLEDEDFGE